MKKGLSAAAVILGLCIFSTGCSLKISDSSLLRPPKTTGREAELEKLIAETANDSYKLKYPQNGEFRSAIITEDLNGDKKDEAIAFFRADNNEKAVNVLIMYDDKNEWKISGNFEKDFTDVDTVQFADYDYDGFEEVFIGFSKTGRSSNELNIFDYNPKNHKSKQNDFKIGYSTFTTGDYDQDGGSELLTFNLESTDSGAGAVLTDYNKNKLYTLAKCDMDINVTKFENTDSGLINKDTIGVAVDGLTENGYNSQVVYYNSSKRALINYPESKKHNSISRPDKVFSTDIDHDGFIEIPVMENDFQKSNSNSESVAPVINWSCINTKKNNLKTKVKCVSNADYGYYFKLPEDFIDSTVTTLSEDNRVMKIYSEDSGVADELIATFKIFDVGTSVDDMNGYSTLESYNQYIYTYKIEDNTPISISEDTLKENFALNDLSA